MKNLTFIKLIYRKRNFKENKFQELRSMINNLCKEYINKESKTNPQNPFPEEACLGILSKMLQIFCNHTNELEVLLDKKHYVEALGKAKLLCDYEQRLTKEVDSIASFYQVGRKEFKESIDRLNFLKSESKTSLKTSILILKEANKTVFPLSLFNYLVN